MKIVIQRVSQASVAISGEKISAVGRGLMVLVGVVEGDTEADARKLAAKCAKLRIFPDDKGVMNRSVIDVGGEVLAVSQFTLAANVKRGNRPSYIEAAPHSLAIPLYELFCAEMQLLTGRPTLMGRFGADMQVELINDGPVTIIMDSREL